MSIRNKLAVVAVSAALAALMVPSLAQEHDAMGHGPGMGDMDHGTMSGGMMSGGMMNGGMMSDGEMPGHCAGMMQTMNGAGGRPNSQWQKHRPSEPMPN